jgi:hypothetical protein
LFKAIAILYQGKKIAVVLTICFLSLFTTGSFMPLAASAQEARTDTDSSAMGCEPMMSNVTMPSLDENVLPPKMFLVYEDEIIQGELSQSKYREGETFSDLDILPESVVSELPADKLEIVKGTCAQFVVKGTPQTLPPNSLDVSAYSTNGTSVGVLDAVEDNTSTFRIDLPRGAYILLGTATWIPSSTNEYVTGYVIYKFLANVTES